jgi:hypothetical protein
MSDEKVIDFQTRREAPSEIECFAVPGTVVRQEKVWRWVCPKERGGCGNVCEMGEPKNVMELARGVRKLGPCPHCGMTQAVAASRMAGAEQFREVGFEPVRLPDLPR